MEVVRPLAHTMFKVAKITAVAVGLYTAATHYSKPQENIAESVSSGFAQSTTTVKTLGSGLSKELDRKDNPASVIMPVVKGVGAVVLFAPAYVGAGFGGIVGAATGEAAAWVKRDIVPPDRPKDPFPGWDKAKPHTL